jgi:hypothetical protein
MEVIDGIGSVSNKRCVVYIAAQVLLLVIDTSVALRVALLAVDVFAQTNAGILAINRNYQIFSSARDQKQRPIHTRLKAKTHTYATYSLRSASQDC